VAANSAADFSVSVEDVVDLSATATATDLTNGKVAWYAVTVPEGSSGQLSVALSGTYDSAAPLTVTLYGTDSSTMLDSATLLYHDVVGDGDFDGQRDSRQNVLHQGFRR
jgi:hypothetical protein